MVDLSYLYFESGAHIFLNLRLIPANLSVSRDVPIDSDYTYSYGLVCVSVRTFMQTFTSTLCFKKLSQSVTFYGYYIYYLLCDKTFLWHMNLMKNTRGTTYSRYI